MASKNRRGSAAKPKAAHAKSTATAASSKSAALGKGVSKRGRKTVPGFPEGYRRTTPVITNQPKD
jgi:hypothetical protein